MVLYVLTNAREGGRVQNREPWKRQSKQAKHGGKEREDGRVGKPQREQIPFYIIFTGGTHGLEALSVTELIARSRKTCWGFI